MSWTAADAYCRIMDSHLVYINDAEENSFVEDLMQCASVYYASIGLIKGNGGKRRKLCLEMARPHNSRLIPTGNQHKLPSLKVALK
ncbi:hypothetical protein HOLleu_22648 [Holothuria leucospilota]|uniref:C-type lectin domain-containing protein n=1 Tax=Holothuria leucospilota TaxID=206669 RepID=A0A9Q1BZH7_HOLLE|nr:hypothetical protein HOLleu_22648 [Holothuria leucospilota]